jgi:hypothetical protein
VFEHQQGLLEGFANHEMVDYARRTTRDPSLRQPPLRMTEETKGR